MTNGSTLKRPDGELSSAQKRHLKSLAHHLDPKVRMGRAGASASVVSETARTIDAHELIKVRIDLDGARERRDAAGRLADQVGAHLVGTIGKIAILYRANEEKPRIKLPGAK